ncbi:MAG: outer membrane protein assembly factor BamC [Gammaproteobacteria bacterium]|nr:outer membrane protein assembly factor BamC [Gammaproteobacteria bacterium]
MKREIPTVAAWVFGICFLTSCAYMPDIGKILPDKKSEYKKSESMPDLEIPPDLTADAINDSMNIPNEAPVTLSRYRNPRTPGSPGVSIGTTEADEQLLSLSIPVNLLWPDLVEFVESKNYTVELEDSELGVLETGWSQADEQTGLQYRYKYRIFAEPGDTADASVLIISQERQTRLDDNSDWLDQGKDAALERQFAADLSLFIGPGEPVAEPATAVAAGADTGAVTQAGSGMDLRVVDAGEGKMYLSIPEAFELAWKNTGLALRDSGLQIVGGDADKGFYLVTGGAPQGSEKKGFFSRLAFWKGDGNADASWQINLTGVGNRTELIVVNEDDEWEATDDAARILALIRDRYPVN